jgi:hypothetical protein
MVIFEKNGPRAAKTAKKNYTFLNLSG